jgi:hypothetical protein
MKTIKNFKDQSLELKGMGEILGGKQLPTQSSATMVAMDDDGCCNSYQYTDSFYDTNGDGSWGCNESGTESWNNIGWDDGDCSP